LIRPAFALNRLVSSILLFTFLFAQAVPLGAESILSEPTVHPELVPARGGSASGGEGERSLSRRTLRGTQAPEQEREGPDVVDSLILALSEVFQTVTQPPPATPQGTAVLPRAAAGMEAVAVEEVLEWKIGGNPDGTVLARKVGDEVQLLSANVSEDGKTINLGETIAILYERKTTAT